MSPAPDSSPTPSPVRPPPVALPDIDVESITLPPYALMLHNDDVNSMEHVVAALMKSVPELTAENAVTVMMEAHTNGMALVIVCPLERAELYRDRLESQSLTATIEKA